MERDNTFKEHHFWELQRKDALNTGLSLQIGAATLLISALYPMLKSITAECSFSNHLLVVGAVLTGASLIGTLICIAMSVFGYAYHHTPDMRTLYGDRVHYEGQSRDVASPDDSPVVIAERALTAFYVRMDKSYSDAAGHNADENQRKNRWIYRANRFLAASLICFALTGVPYLGVTLGADEKPVKVQLVNRRSEPMADKEKDAPPPPPPPTAQRREMAHPPERRNVVSLEHAIPTGDLLTENTGSKDAGSTK